MVQDHYTTYVLSNESYVGVRMNSEEEKFTVVGTGPTVMGEEIEEVIDKYLEKVDIMDRHQKRTDKSRQLTYSQGETIKERMSKLKKKYSGMDAGEVIEDRIQSRINKED